MPSAPTSPPTDRSTVRVLQALADGNRQRIVASLGRGERCVCEIQEELGLAQSLLSHHLRTLREAGLVADRRDGRWVHYRLVPEVLGELLDFLGALRTEALSNSTRTSCCPP